MNTLSIKDILAAGPCGLHYRPGDGAPTGFAKLCIHLGWQPGGESLSAFVEKFSEQGQRIPLLTILISNGLQDAAWCLKCDRKQFYLPSLKFRAEVLTRGKWKITNPKVLDWYGYVGYWLMATELKPEIIAKFDEQIGKATPADTRAAWLFRLGQCPGPILGIGLINDAIHLIGEEAATEIFKAKFY